MVLVIDPTLYFHVAMVIDGALGGYVLEELVSYSKLANRIEKT